MAHEHIQTRRPSCLYTHHICNAEKYLCRVSPDGAEAGQHCSESDTWASEPSSSTHWGSKSWTTWVRHCPLSLPMSTGWDTSRWVSLCSLGKALPTESPCVHWVRHFPLSLSVSIGQETSCWVSLSPRATWSCSLSQNIFFKRKQFQGQQIKPKAAEFFWLKGAMGYERSLKFYPTQLGNP